MTLSAQIEQRTLAATLKRLASIVETRNTIPALANVAIRATADAVTLTVTDMDIEATATIAATVINPGATTVPAKMLSDIVAKLPAGSLVSITEADGRATVSAGRSTFQLGTLPIEDFPVLASPDFTSTFNMPASDMHTLFAGIFAASTEETRYYLNGVYLHPRNGQVIGVTTNGHQLAHMSIEAEHDFPGVIVPRKTVLEVAKSFTDGDIEVSVSETKIRFTSPGFTLLSKVIDGTFPDYTRVIPQSHPNAATFNYDEARIVVDRVLTVSGEKIRSVKLTITDDTIAVENRSTINAATDSMGCTMTGGAIEIGFNGQYLMDILKQVQGDARMEYNTPQGPAIIRGSGAGFFVLMPYRV